MEEEKKSRVRAAAVPLPLPLETIANSNSDLISILSPSGPLQTPRAPSITRGGEIDMDEDDGYKSSNEQSPKHSSSGSCGERPESAESSQKRNNSNSSNNNNNNNNNSNSNNTNNNDDGTGSSSESDSSTVGNGDIAGRGTITPSRGREGMTSVKEHDAHFHTNTNRTNNNNNEDNGCGRTLRAERGVPVAADKSSYHITVSPTKCATPAAEEDLQREILSMAETLRWQWGGGSCSSSSSSTHNNNNNNNNNTNDNDNENNKYTNKCNSDDNENSNSNKDTGKEMSSSREDLRDTSGPSADHHPLPTYNSDYPSSPAFKKPSRLLQLQLQLLQEQQQQQEEEQERQQLQPLQLLQGPPLPLPLPLPPVAAAVPYQLDEKEEKEEGEEKEKGNISPVSKYLLHHSGRAGGGRRAVCRRRVRGGRPTTVSGLLGAGGSGATTVALHNRGSAAVAGAAASSSASIGGHHVTIQRDGVFMKESCSRREEEFYEKVRPVQEYVRCHTPLLASLYSYHDDDYEEEEEEEEDYDGSGTNTTITTTTTTTNRKNNNGKEEEEEEEENEEREGGMDENKERDENSDYNNADGTVKRNNYKMLWRHWRKQQLRRWFTGVPAFSVEGISTVHRNRSASIGSMNYCSNNNNNNNNNNNSSNNNTSYNGSADGGGMDSHYRPHHYHHHHHHYHHNSKGRSKKTESEQHDGQRWYVLLQLIPFIPRFIGLCRMTVTADSGSGSAAVVSNTNTNKNTTLPNTTTTNTTSSSGSTNTDTNNMNSNNNANNSSGEPGPPATNALMDGKTTSTPTAVPTCKDGDALAISGGGGPPPPTTTNMNSNTNSKTVRQMIVLEDLCSGFTHPCILDIKMGSRQYGLNPSEAKLRSKERKAAQSTSMQYGVRLAGMKRWCADTQQYETQSKIAGRYLTLDELRETVARFTQHSQQLRLSFRAQLRRLRRVFQQQQVFRFYTSSLLFIYDADRPLLSARVVMVDFAFTYEREELRRGGDPDAADEKDVGYIKALNTMIAILS
ncbi:putative inositol polyphosphate kinase-like protein [Trypanosoma theileri]|uniref:Kinase n=1 Tax=Trypanosoma theileri TaxID=67003 RepID=A0A1X0NPC8_9TRYP|nr:putative inositol polyphosphate kinase-like protein [Trypanosoma theileri]ORC86343.1 putative inositol polyphosphate kinase-like protein [Trypanosoma theileri]